MTVDTASNSGTDVPTEPVNVGSETELNELVDDSGVVLADFYADWCGPCQMLAPIVDNLAAETDAVVAKIDVDANQQLAKAYGVRGVPTLVLFADGQQVEEIVGVQAEEQLRELIQNYTEE
ncbi:thioredoxin (plasmid) [Halorussus limi]|uniref:Thioredoxin n=1 Tax=Halorussus limi TaxID=2938695 RepID=A0A8U0I1J8_9EURY|nr:thioredoxin [Halorussus limi]UPV76913.1 thioredoxin [Halorussus limi]